MKYLLPGLFVLLFILTAHADEWFTFNGESGLPKDSKTLYTSIIKGSNGNVWASCWGGVYAYNGESWYRVLQESRFKTDAINDIIEDKNGKMWFATEDGVTTYDRPDWEQHDFEGESSNANRVFSLFEDSQGYIWAGTFEAIHRFDGQSWTTWDTSNGLGGHGVECITEDKDGNIWCGSLGAVNRFDGQSWTNFDDSDGIPGSMRYIRHIEVDEENTVWVGTFTGGVTYYDGTEWITMDTADGLADMEVHNIRFDSSGNKWFCTGFNGISMQKPSGEWEYFNNSNGLETDYVNVLILDEEAGERWFASKAAIYLWKSGTNNINASQNQMQKQLSVTTSPANVQLHFVSSVSGPVSIALYSMMGQKLISEESYAVKGLNKTSLTKSAIAQGVYLLELRSGNTIIAQEKIRLQ